MSRAVLLVVLPLLALALLGTGTPETASAAKAKLRPVGAKALSDRAAARRVRRSSWEPRHENAWNNRRVPTRAELQRFRRESDMPYKGRVTGRFTGTTDEIIQWAAHKHGLPEDLMRAVAVHESWWKMSTVGDDGDSFGLYQVRRPYHCCEPFMNESTAFNADYYAAIMRAYYDGRMGWLNGEERGRPYRPGDLYGSIGAWVTGRWHLPRNEEYVAVVKRHMREKTWLGQWF